MNGHLFAPQRREGAKPFGAFRTYLDMGPERSLAAVSQKLSKSEQLLKRWSAKFGWLARVRAHEEHLARVEREAAEALRVGKAAEWEMREQALRETEWAMHERAIAAAKRGLDAFMEREKVYANLADIARMLEIASKLGRLATGLGTDGDGNLFVVDEHAERLWLPQRHAAAIKAMVARHRVANSRWGISNSQAETRPLELADLKRFVAGADVFSRQSDGTTVAAQYARHGITLRCANTDRLNGWAEILTRFGDVEGGIRPSLFIHRRCARLIETLPALQHDPNRPEDVLKVDADEEGVGGDDCADALRYLVATKSRAITQRKLRGL